MKQRSSLSILCFVFISFRIAPVSAQPRIQNSKYFTSNGTYDANRHSILSSLPSNAAARSGFYNGSIGEVPNRVYAVGMCIPGSTPGDCSDCIETTSDFMIELCPNQTDAFGWTLDPTLCLVRYSNISSQDLQHFGKFHRTSAARSTPTSSNNYYTANVLALEKFSIYVLMHCTPDISPGDCDYCLRQVALEYRSCCENSTGGYVMRPICFFRWQLYRFSKAFDNITLDLPPPPLQPPQPSSATTDNGSGKISTGAIVAIIVSIVVAVFIIITLVLLALRSVVLFWRRKPYQEIYLDQSGITTVDSLQFDLKTIEVATDKFTSNKLGQGGYGEVFKGTLPNGIEIAVKRLSQTSTQGAEEFRNEVVVVAKLQHRNLVRLLGFCLEREEKILVYEFVPNKSLDYFLFDPTKNGQLEWTKRYNIIWGITRGILYLHQDSRLTIIHRDLKASNILLDAGMNPKIADFGVARIFGMDQSEANTNRIVGTRGYMSPEYLMQGLFSTKSDVYSFGVLVLEIISGRNNRFVHQSGTTVENLVTYAWRLWRNGSHLELVDPTISENCQTEEVTRCIHIALLCVQEDPTDRPSLSAINQMLTNNSLILPAPHRPGFFFPNRRNQERDGLESSQSTTRSDPQTINDVTITDLEPR